MKIKYISTSLKLLLVCLVFIGARSFITNYHKKKNTLPSGFVFLADVDDTIIESVRYATDENFMGRIIPGYKSRSKIVCTKIAAEKLKKAHNDLKAQGYRLVVYDGYRPQTAVDAFLKWGKDDHDILEKEYYYPTIIDKQDLFQLQYLAEKSGHSRGSTFDLTIIKNDAQLKPIEASKRKLKNNEEVSFLDDNTIDMGSSFDLFHEASHHDSQLISTEHLMMRNFLRTIMESHGFKGYPKEWWHYTLEEEPYPDTYFDFVVNGIQGSR